MSTDQGDGFGAYMVEQGILPAVQPRKSLLETVADAIEAAGCPGREGPFGLYDYSSYPGDAPPHVVRDFRPGSRSYGHTLYSTTNRSLAEAFYTKLTREHIADAAVKALDQWRLEAQTRRTKQWRPAPVCDDCDFSTGHRCSKHR